MQLGRKDRVCFAFQENGLGCDHVIYFTTERAPAITDIIIDESRSVKGQRLITSRWSEPTFLKGTSLLDSISRRSKVKSVSATPGPSWAVFESIRSLLVQSFHTLVRAEASY